MAATRLIPLHVNKGKTVAQCLADRTDYSENEKKTNNGEFISSYECNTVRSAEESSDLAKNHQGRHCGSRVCYELDLAQNYQESAKRKQN